MPEGGTVFIPVLPQFANFERQLVLPMRAAAQKAGNELNSGLKAAAQAGAVVVGAILVKALVGAAKAASDLGESVNKANVIFQQSAESVRHFAEGAASIGIAEGAALDAAAGFGAMFHSLGFADDASAHMSETLVTLAADMASFNNQDPSEILAKLQSGLAGQVRPLRTLGVFLDEARLKQEAYATGVAQAGEELTATQKIQVRYNLILKDTERQQGDFARTLGQSLPNQARKLSAEMHNLSASIGQDLLPVFLQGTKVVEFLVGTFNELPGPVKAATGVILGAGAALVIVGGAVGLVRSALASLSLTQTAQTAASVIQGAAISEVATVAMPLYIANAQGMVVATREVAAAQATQTASTGVAAGGIGLLGPVAIAAGAALLTYAAMHKFSAERAKEDAEATANFVEVLRRDVAPTLDEIKAKIEAQPIPGWAKDIFIADVERAAQQVALMDQNEDHLRFTEGLLTTQTANFSGSLYGLAGAHQAAKIAANQQWQAELQLSGGLLGIVSAEQGAEDATQSLREARQAVNQALKDHGKHSKEYRAALAAEARAELSSVQSQLAIKQSLAQYADELRGPVTEALDAVTAAQAALKEAQDKSAASPEDAAALEAFAQAQDDLAAKTLAYNKAILAMGPNQQDAIDLIERLGKQGLLTAAEVQTFIDSIAELTRGLHGIPPLVTTTVQTIFVTSGGSTNRNLQTNARGTRDAPGGWSLVGEEGAELMWLPPHSQVLPAAATRDVMAGRAAPHFAEGTTGAAATTMGGLSRRDIVEAIIEGFSKVDLNMDGWQVGRGMARAALSRSGGG